MNKKILVILSILLSVSLSACTSKQADTKTVNNNVSQTNNTSKVASSTQNNNSHNNSENSSVATYQLSEETYKYKDTIIHYPQVTGLADITKQNKINSIIKDDALYHRTNVDNLGVEIKYTIELKNADILSIKYEGIEYFKGAAHPNDAFYTTNIDIATGSKLRLLDLVNIDNNLVNAYRKGTYINFMGISASDLANEINAERSDTDLIKAFNLADENNTSEVCSYLTPDYLVISTQEAFAIGSHAEFEIKYKDIQNNIINNNLLKLAKDTQNNSENKSKDSINVD